MATVTVTNISSSVLFVRELYISLAAGASVTVDRTPTELGAMRGLQTEIAAGLVSISVVLSADDISSGLVPIFGESAVPVAANPTALAAMSSSGMATGTKVYVTCFRQMFVLDTTSSATADGSTVVNATTGRWVREPSWVYAWQTQANWYIDPASGSDLNIGTSQGAPLKTIGELIMRLHGVISRPVTVTFVTAPVAADPLSGLSLTAAPNSFISSSPPSLTVSSVRSTKATGTVTAMTNAVTSGVSQAFAILTDSAAAFDSTYVGKLLMLADGKSCVIIKVTSATTVNVTAFFDPVTYSIAANPATSTAYTVYDFVPFTGSYGLPFATLAGSKPTLGSTALMSWKVKYLYIDVTLVGSTVEEYASSTLFQQSIIRAPSASACQYYGDVSYGGSAISLPGSAALLLGGRVPRFAALTACGVIGSGASSISIADAALATSFTAFTGCQISWSGVGTVTIGNGSALFDCTAATGAINVGRPGALLVVSSSSFYGNNNTVGLRVNGGQCLINSASFVPALTGTTELKLDAVTTVLPDLLASAGGSLPAAVSAVSWSDFTANGRSLVNHKTGSRISGI